MDASAGAILRERERIRHIVCSAVEIVLPPGVFITIIPFLVAAATSTLSRPTPARPITLSLSAQAIRSAVTFVSLRTISAS